MIKKSGSLKLKKHQCIAERLVLLKGSGWVEVSVTMSGVQRPGCFIVLWWEEHLEMLMMRGYRMAASVCLCFPDVIAETTCFSSTVSDLINKFDVLLAYVQNGATGLCFWPDITLRYECFLSLQPKTKILTVVAQMVMQETLEVALEQTWVSDSNYCVPGPLHQQQDYRKYTENNTYIWHIRTLGWKETQSRTLWLWSILSL